MSPGQLGSDTGPLQSTQTLGKCLRTTPPPPPSSSQNSTRCGLCSAPLCQLGAGALCLFKGSLVLIVTVACGETLREATVHSHGTGVGRAQCLHGPVGTGRRQDF